MRRLVPLLALMCVATPALASSSGIPCPFTEPDTIAFADSANGVLGNGFPPCSSHCRYHGSIALTHDGGRTWHTVLDTPRPVVWLAARGRYYGGGYEARLDDGETLASTDGGRHWAPTVADRPGPVPCGLWAVADDVAITSDGTWYVLCMGEPGAGNQAKAVFALAPAGWRRRAWTPFDQSKPVGQGGLALYGYPVGIAMADDGLGIIWQSRGVPFYVTTDAARHWRPADGAMTDRDFGLSASAVGHGTAFVLLEQSGRVRLIATHDAGRTWRAVHRWG